LQKEINLVFDLDETLIYSDDFYFDKYLTKYRPCDMVLYFTKKPRIAYKESDYAYNFYNKLFFELPEEFKYIKGFEDDDRDDGDIHDDRDDDTDNNQWFDKLKFIKPFMHIFTNTHIPVILNTDSYKIYKRPYTDFTLNILSKFCKLHIFSAAEKCYAEPIIKHCFGSDLFITKTYRGYDESYGKSVCSIGNNAILIDDKLYNHVHGEKFYHIPQYTIFNNNDIELLKLLCCVIWNEIL
jgi:hypothetical protein